MVFDKGLVVERGTHEALLAADGRYAALARRQIKGSAWKVKKRNESQLLKINKNL